MLVGLLICLAIVGVSRMAAMEPLEFAPPPPPAISFFDQLMNDSCGWSCEYLDSLGPPPDAILSMPPPPLPPFLQQVLSENESFKDNSNCNFCNIFHDPSLLGPEMLTPKSDVKSDEPWTTRMMASIIGSTVFGILFLIFLIKYKKWKIFPVSDSCPILPDMSFLSGHKSAPPPCTPTECISPVVNEKSPQSIITDSPTKKTSISSKYWKRGSNTILNNPDGRSSVEPNSCIDIDPYNDTASCTSSPVYAELDASGVSVTHALTSPSPLILGGPSISPYAVCNTYSEVADAVRMAALGSSSALLPDASYDNAAYLPTSNSDHYHNHSRSLRRAHRASTLAQLGSATPLLSSHYQINQFNNGSPQLNYLTGGRPHKKPRPLHAQVPRANLARMQEELQSMRFDRQSGHGRRAQGVYNDLPAHSPSLSTFRVPNAFRDNPKRPLPPVPGVRL